MDHPNQRPRCKQRGIKLAALQSSGVFGLRSASVGAKHVPLAHSTPRGSRQISMQAWLLGSLLAGINAISRLQNKTQERKSGQ
ncbi:hypothetical protein HMPREF1548_03790 [Clostridium sp. KLE 1755]|nr:hypothetical protein HMPREF1548_03790 [Clostridium sp. KLE 1755]